ncbi:MAG: hypothetical protein RIQ89_665 [Bacteroidota bacterium]|jgi:nicotinamide-nucleotide amidase
MTYAEIITIGDELLIGQVIDTNSAWMGQKLNAIGITVKQITSISDDESAILTALSDAAKRASIVLITGGLGPTKDDITKYALCKYFKSNLRFDEQAFINIEKIFLQRGKTVSAINRKQAEVPEKCSVIQNAKGTAPGMWFEKEGVVYVSMPGVPYEMKAIMHDGVLPMLVNRFSLPSIVHRTIWTQGIGESYLSEMISEWEHNLPSHIKLAYLPQPGMVRLRLTGKGANEAALKQEINTLQNQVLPIISDHVFGYDEDTLEVLIAELIASKNLSLSVAESCTGGYISHRITAVPGASAFFKGSLVPYSNEIKIAQLEVSAETIKQHGAVSEQTAKQMVKGAQKFFGSDIAIATTGIAGPSGGSEEKPIGTVYLAIAIKEKIDVFHLKLGSHRERVIIETALYAFSHLRKLLLQNS